MAQACLATLIVTRCGVTGMPMCRTPGRLTGCLGCQHVLAAG
jgi:hypothetical protein